LSRKWPKLLFTTNDAVFNIILISTDEFQPNSNMRFGAIRVNRSDSRKRGYDWN